MGPLEAHLRARRDAGRKLLITYMTGGLRDAWPELVRAMADSGADAVEIGIPFSDPVMDGPTIQAASQRALARKDRAILPEPERVGRLADGPRRVRQQVDRRVP